jgi:hypothetical protein
MAKLGKQKFNILGDHNSSRTTFSGTIELYLYYSSEDDIFYFDTEELKKYIPETSLTWYKSMFEGCRTKNEAVSVVEMLLASQIKETRKLRISIGMNSDIFKVPNPKYKKKVPGSPMKDWNFEEQTITDPTLPQYLKNMLKDGLYGGHGLKIEFVRIMELELNGLKRYAGCDKNWKYNRSHLSSQSENLIDWTPAAEDFFD